MIVVMGIILILIVIVTIGILRLINLKDDKKVVKSLKKYVYIIFSFLFTLYIILGVAGVYLVKESDLFIIPIIRMIFELLFFIVIFKKSKQLLKNLEEDLIFEDSNVKLIKDIANQFLYLTLVHIIAGLILGLVVFIIGVGFVHEIMFSTNTLIVIYIGIALLLLVISVIMKKAIEIYNENKLTIW